MDYLQPSLCTSSKNQTPYSGNGCTPEVRKHPSNPLYQCCPLALMVLVVLGDPPALEDLCLPLRQVLLFSPSNLERQNLEKIGKLQHSFDAFQHLRTGESHEMRSKSIKLCYTQKEGAMKDHCSNVYTSKDLVQMVS